MIWTEIKIKTTEEAYDAISEMLMTIGAGGVAIDDPNEIRREIAKPNTLDYADDNFVNSLGNDVFIKAYFPDISNIVELKELIAEMLVFISNFLNIGEGLLVSSEIDEEDWANAWKKYYKPIKISDTVIIKPTWEEYKRENNEIVIEMDPGMAFGTGTHETTRMCAQLLEKYIKKGDAVIDIGCGTGILSIIAGKLGASHITAVDVDEVAVRVTKENCINNNVENLVNSFKGELKDIKTKKVDIVIANIIAAVIIDISDMIPKFLKEGGYFITSGIIKERKQDVIDIYTKLGFVHKTDLQMGEWVAIGFICPDSL